MDFGRIDREYLFRRAHQKWGRWDRDVIPLSVADIDYPPPPEVRETVEAWLRDDRTPYGPYQGEPELRRLLAEKVRSANGIPAGEEEIVVIPGTMFGIFLATYLFLGPGDEAILTPAPVYGPFWKNVQAAGATPVPHDMDMDDGFRFRGETLASLVTPRTRLLMVCNPHNPTGRVLSREELAGIARVALDHDLLIFVDELYEDMVFEGRHLSLAGLGEEVFRRTVTAFGFSKAFGIPGYRVAYLVAPPALRERLVDASRRMIVHTDCLSQAAAMGALRSSSRWVSALMGHLREMRDRSLERVRAMPGLRCHRPQASPFLFPDVRGLGMKSQELARHVLTRGRVVVYPGDQFGPAGEGFVRLNIATSWDVLDEALARMEQALGELKRR
jgi:aspartate/methionine/tyrosine aminotransferase